MWDLHALAEPTLTCMLRAEDRRIDFRIGDDDVFDLTLDAAIDLAKLARSWDPDGALLWVWARRRIAGLVHGHIGVFADGLDDTVLDIEAPSLRDAEGQPREVLRSLALSHPAARRLDRGLDAVTERDADIYLRVQLEKAVGNRSPAVTIGVECDLRPAAVRKVVQRVLERLADVAERVEQP
ncbi:MAG: hypothetical protein ABIP36_03300 [Acidimicrobiales bacterium]